MRTIVIWLTAAVVGAGLAACQPKVAERPPGEASAAKANAAPTAGAAVEASNAAATPEAAAKSATAPEGKLISYPFGTVQRGSIWARPEWTPTSEKPIDVCWENPGAAPAASLDLVQQAVRDTWEKASLVKFVWTRTCPPASKGIRIRIADEGPHVKALGRYLINYPQGMVLNFQFENWSPACQNTKDYCARVVAAHEFGHALGFAHEQNRADAPFECRQESQGTDGDWNITTYDPDSIMNYCNTRWNNGGMLSVRDRQAVTTLYGARG